MRAADHELTRRVHEILDLVVEELQHFGVMDAGNDARHQDVHHILPDLFEHFAVGLFLSLLRCVSRLDELIVLGRHHNGIDADGTAVVIVLNRHLALRVGTEIGHHLAFATDVCQYHQQLVGQVERERHVVFRLVGGIAEHHALVAGPLVHGFLAFHAPVDVCTLFVDGREHAAGIAFEHVFALRITDTVDHLAGYPLQVDVRFRFHFTCQYHLSCRHQRFARHLRVGVISQQFVEYGV